VLISFVYRDILLEYLNQVKKVGTLLLELLSEALGLNSTYLADIGCAEGFYAFGHYYPPCPEPELTLGTSKHVDVVFLTVLLQDHVGGLQFLHKDVWIDVPPIPEALIVNIGDFLQACFVFFFSHTNVKYMSLFHAVFVYFKDFVSSHFYKYGISSLWLILLRKIIMANIFESQLITNDKFKSVHHRVPANLVGPRVSIASFFGTLHHPTTRTFGPIKELLSEKDSAKYKETSPQKFMDNYITKCNKGTSPRLHFKN